MKGIGGGFGGNTIKTIQPPLSRSTGNGVRHVRKRRRHSNTGSCHTACQLPHTHTETKIIALGTVTTLIVGYTFIRFLFLPFAVWVQQRSVDSLGRQQDTLENDPRNRLFQLPNRVENVELWVAPTNIKMMKDYDTLMEQELRQHMLQQCLPSEKVHCRRSGPQSTEMANTERIAILRPPGRLGRIMEDYVTNYILDKSSTDEDDSKITIIAQPNHEATATIDHDWTSYTKMIRPVVMPILLEVLDLVIQTTTNTATTIDDADPHSLVDFITIPDIITTLRILVQYHCYVGQLATVSSSQAHLPTLTVSLHQLMTYPQEVNDALMEFLTIDHHHHSKLDPQQTARLEFFATTIFQLYDTATVLLQQLVTKYDTLRTTAATTTTTDEPAPSFYDLIKSAIREELNHGYCNGDLRTSSAISASSSSSSSSSSASKLTLHRFQFDDTLTSTTDGRIVTRMTSSQSTEMIRSMLVENSLIQICHVSPQTRFCHL